MTRQEYNREASSRATCNWVEVRNQAAIAAMQGLLSNTELVLSANNYVVFGVDIEKGAVRYADALVEQLKEK